MKLWAMKHWRLHPAAVLALSFVAGAIPSSNIAARRRASVDLRDVGSGTVSGTALYRVAGFAPLAVTGIIDIAKAAIGPALAGRSRPQLAALAGGVAIAGHNWSPFLKGAGGRGFAPSLGALGAQSPWGIPVMLGGLVGGRAVSQTGLGGFVAQCALGPVLYRVQGRRGVLVAACVVASMWLKRLAGNERPAVPSARVYARRLLLDTDEPAQ
jgi:glycerol-3-phosphate acyltransferase PlsY